MPFAGGGYVPQLGGVETLGGYVLRRREEIGLSQGAVASAAGIDANAVWMIETGKTRTVRTRTLQGLAEALRVPIEELAKLNRAEPRKPSAAARLESVMRLRGYTLDPNDRNTPLDIDKLHKAARVPIATIESLLNGGRAHRLIVERIATVLVRSGDTDPAWIEGLIADESAFDDLLAQVATMELPQLQALDAAVRKRMKTLDDERKRKGK